LENFASYRGGVDFDSKAFGRRVASAREWIGLKPKELAAALGRSAESVNAIERGDRKDPPDKLLLTALAEALKVEAPWLLSGTQPPWTVASPTSAQAFVDSLAGIRVQLAAIDNFMRELEVALAARLSPEAVEAADATALARALDSAAETAEPAKRARRLAREVPARRQRASG
jgi:transcriptional regulator with XRE-family HTH domain